MREEEGGQEDRVDTHKKCGWAWEYVSYLEHIELPAKLLDYFLRSNKSNINQCVYIKPHLKFLINSAILGHELISSWGGRVSGVYAVLPI